MTETETVKTPDASTTLTSGLTETTTTPSSPTGMRPSISGQKEQGNFCFSLYLLFRSLSYSCNWALVYYRGPVFLADFEIIPIEAVRGQIYGVMGAGVRGRSPLLGEGIRGSFRLGRLGIGMISKSVKKTGPL